jgi:hypothetical protein
MGITYPNNPCQHMKGVVIGNQLPHAVAGLCDKCGEETVYMNVKMYDTDTHIKIMMDFGMVMLEKE